MRLYCRPWGYSCGSVRYVLYIAFFYNLIYGFHMKSVRQILSTREIHCLTSPLRSFSGVLHPEVISAFGLNLPCCAIEMNIEYFL